MKAEGAWQSIHFQGPKLDENVTHVLGPALAMLRREKDCMSTIDGAKMHRNLFIGCVQECNSPQDSGAGVLEHEVLIGELVAVDGLSSGTCE